MNAPDSDLAPSRIAELLRTQRLGRSCEFLPVCGSTNDEIRKRALAGAAEGSLVVADSQTNGRGRLGHTWHSPQGTNLYLSLLLRPRLSPRLATPLTLLAGAALAQILAAAGLRPRLKWPNDVLLEDNVGLRKVAGILTEMASEGDRIRYVVVGVGINVNSVDFPPELAERATALALVSGTKHDRGKILTDFLAAFEPIYDSFLSTGPAAGLTRWREFAQLGAPCQIPCGQTALAGTVAGLDDDGALLVRDVGGRLHRVLSGEVG